MTRSKIYLLLISSATILFASLLVLGAHFWLQETKWLAIILFLLGFICVLGQMAALACFLRERATTTHSSNRLKKHK